MRDVNAARAQRGLPPLAPDDNLSQFALQVAQQMAERHYFGHTDPNGITFQDRLRASRLRYGFAAENMAFDQDEAHANQAFLHSPGHYANIVDPHPRRVGAAVVAAGDGEVFYVEEFADYGFRLRRKPCAWRCAPSRLRVRRRTYGPSVAFPGTGGDDATGRTNHGDPRR